MKYKKIECENENKYYYFEFYEILNNEILNNEMFNYNKNITIKYFYYIVWTQINFYVLLWTECFFLIFVDNCYLIEMICWIEEINIVLNNYYNYLWKKNVELFYDIAYHIEKN